MAEKKITRNQAFGLPEEVLNTIHQIPEGIPEEFVPEDAREQLELLRQMEQFKKPIPEAFEVPEGFDTSSFPQFPENFENQNLIPQEDSGEPVGFFLSRVIANAAYALLDLFK